MTRSNPFVNLRRILLPAMLVLVTSCGSSRKPCFPVHGEVFAGQGTGRIPAAGAVVIFTPKDGPPRSEGECPHAQVGEDGKFVVTTFVNGDGAPAGDYTITIHWTTPRPPPPYKPKNVVDKLDGQYGDPKKAEISYSVERRRDNAIPPIELP